MSDEGDAKWLSALGTTTRGREGGLIGGCGPWQVICRRRWFLAQLTAGGEVDGAAVVMEQTESSGGTQACRWNMIEESGDELLGRECEERLAMLVRMFVGDAQFAFGLSLDAAL